MMNIWGMTDIGLVRRENQDAYAVRISEDSGHTICVVCDGMGGPGGGKLASTLAVDAFVDSCLANLRWDMSWEQVKETAVFAVAAANTAIYERACIELGLQGMGTTLVSAIVRDGRAVFNNVGDSRAYLIRRGVITRITKDHSLVERLVDQGDITEEEARCHPHRNLITRALGPDREALSDSYEVFLEPGDWLLLCTDGLTGTVTDLEMARELTADTDDNERLSRLLQLAKKRGAPDNVTAVLLRQQ
ncbi:MAG: Stp1/IreP family PP2C-type Ser/Thr phosphatase [Oscillospiraceae bacterium]|nr:Stp1/IreP family PP2C-type Ser/Thr phosphatase [Oscillospiraceae bacterium]